MHLQSDHRNNLLSRDRLRLAVLPLLSGLILGHVAGGTGELAALLVVSAMFVAVAQQTLP
jgi:hypothetical protein